MLQQCATNNWAKCNCHTRHCRPQANSFGALYRINKNICDDCKSRREHEGSTNTHCATPKDELITCCSERCKRAADDKQHETYLQCTLATETVSEATAGKKQTGKYQCIRINNPLQRRCGCVQFALQCGQRHIDDEVVNDNEEHTDGEYPKDPPATVISFLINSHLTVSSRCT